MQLHEEMRMEGIYVEQKEDFCEHYAVIDNEIVWYGSMNLLGKENAEDNLMRVVSKDIAAELMEITFGISETGKIQRSKEENEYGEKTDGKGTD